MDIAAAKRIVQNYKQQRLSVVGEAIAALREEYATYQGVSEQVGVSAGTIGKYYRLSELPHGIRWKVEQGKLSRAHALEICRLRDEHAQWMLAFAILEAPKKAAITPRQCKDAVEDVLRAGKPMKEVLAHRFGLTFNETVPLLLPVEYWFRFTTCRAAWNREQEWQDLAYEILTEWLEGREFVRSGELREVAKELVTLGEQLGELAE